MYLLFLSVLFCFFSCLSQVLRSMNSLLLLLRFAFKSVIVLLQVLFLLYGAYAAYDIRLYPIKDFGYIIHEFDPWFNYRAAEYLAEHGLYKFLRWYDYESWYPIGRPIGTTIYPGMQVTGVVIQEVMKKIGDFKIQTPSVLLAMRPFISFLKRSGWRFLPSIKQSYEFTPMSLNDICCMIPPWFGTYASVFTGLLTYEISRSVANLEQARHCVPQSDRRFKVNAGVAATLIMAIIPAHLMRSVGGEFDNEAVAVTAICSTFWLWLLCVRTPKHWPISVLAGLSYFYMVAVRGFLSNVFRRRSLHPPGMGGLHLCHQHGRAPCSLAGGIWPFQFRGSQSLHHFLHSGDCWSNAGSCRWDATFAFRGAVGSFDGVYRLPISRILRLAKTKAFDGVRRSTFCDGRPTHRRRSMGAFEFAFFRIKVMALLVVVTALVCAALYPTGYFGPISSRIRGLFVKHTKTGNPLVDSVAEHQPANPSMYASYLNLPLDYVLLGGLVCLWHRNNGFLLLCLYGFVAQHFSGKMSRQSLF
eukprot:g1926.t1